jgi:hypothetical protein
MSFSTSKHSSLAFGVLTGFAIFDELRPERLLAQPLFVRRYRK